MTASSPLAAPPVDGARRARVVVPFALVTLIWSSTWIVVRGQLGPAPAEWSVTYRFALAGVAMFVFAAVVRSPLRMSARQHGLAAVYGVTQYAFNYYGVYLAERSLTSGLVAVVFALLAVCNAVLAWLFLRQGVSRPFAIGSAVALLGVAAMFEHELAIAPVGDGSLAIGIGWSLAAVLCASGANVMQASRAARAVPVPTLVAWGMAWGTLFDCAAAGAIAGPPVFPTSWSYWAGVVYLALAGSALAFTLYFGLIRAIGPARAAYTSVLTPALAMILSTLFEGYRWSASAVAGGVLVVGGLVVALRSRQSASPAR